MLRILLLLLLVAAAASAQSLPLPSDPIPAALYGLNINSLKPGVWPIEHFGSLRTFTFRWYSLERSPGAWDFSVPDRVLQESEKHGVTPLPVLMGVPDWADQSADPANAIPVTQLYRRNRERCMPKDPVQWENYIRTIATRYKGRIHAYELWNEPETNATFLRDPGALVKLVATAYRVLHEVDPTIIVLSPALSSGDPVPSRIHANLEEFAAAGLYKYCDAIAYHAYLVPARPDHRTVAPEAIFADTAFLRSVLHANQVPDRPLWDTEIGWELLNDDVNTSRVADYLGDPLTPALTAAYVARTYLLGWAAGWQRMYWYSWDAGGTTLTEQDGSYKVCEGAYNQIHDWTVGRRLARLNRHSDGTWIAELIATNGSHSWILWNESVRGRVSVPPAWHVTGSTDLAGLRTPLKGPAEISQLPILLQ